MRTLSLLDSTLSRKCTYGSLALPELPHSANLRGSVDGFSGIQHGFTAQVRQDGVGAIAAGFTRRVAKVVSRRWSDRPSSA